MGYDNEMDKHGGIKVIWQKRNQHYYQLMI
jgi:hypothetical protein